MLKTIYDGKMIFILKKSYNYKKMKGNNIYDFINIFNIIIVQNI